MVDATYRGDLRELNEPNFARFDAKLEQRIAQVDARIDVLDAKLEQRFAQLEAKFEQRIAQLEARLTHRLFGFWIAQPTTTAGLVFGVVKLDRKSVV